MKHFVSIVLVMFSCVLFDSNRFRKRRSIDSAIRIEIELSDKKQKRRKRKRKYKNRKYKEKKRFRNKGYALKGSHSKDSRYSSQRKLRRMFRND